MSLPSARPKAREAGPELLLLARFEEFTSWLLERTARWPKRVRFTLSQRLENEALDILELLIAARYQREERAVRLRSVNLGLERMRYLLRLAQRAQACPAATFESAVRAIDEVGRMLHGWRQQLSLPLEANP